jgi:hypothetical protein
LALDILISRKAGCTDSGSSLPVVARDILTNLEDIMPPRTGGLTGPLEEGTNAPENFVAAKHKEYFRSAKRYRRLYYATRLCAGLSAGFLPFVVRSSPDTAIFLSFLIVIATVVDSVFSPKDRWAVFSKATDLLAAEQLRATGEHEKWQTALNTIERTESAVLKQLGGIRDFIDQGRHEGRRLPPA